MSKVLVTGGAGFIGSHLVRALVQAGHQVTVLDNFATGRRENLTGVLKNIRLRTGDIRDLKTMRKVSRGVSLVYHLAAISSVPQSVEDPITTGDVNVSGTWNVLEAARLEKVKRVVFVSSASVYGVGTPMPFRETVKVRGSSPYAASKLIGEQLCDLYLHLYGLETVALRLFSVYGPRQNPRSQYANVIPAFVTLLLKGSTPTIYGDGKQTRDFVFVQDVVRAFLLAGRRKAAVGEVMNVGTGRRTSVNQLMRLIQKELGMNLPFNYQPARSGDDPHTHADSSKAKRLLGIKKFATLSEGLATTVRWFADNHNNKK